ncbi:uncharacterized protein LOC122510899 [Leptopilina heterotoma]|uniref:uncharacterized protein LOC122510899 n=1 Tax=Leptopilina heterotoma TaxID=63436 RepID=UPI001CAA410B|nr:uncharacterized protein LOC122510899 [Leptopilina heterotoma]
MEFIKFVIMIFFLIIKLKRIDGHGSLMDPVNRKSAWRKGFPTPEEYTDNESFCGGRDVQHIINGGKCGICGDDYRLPIPRPSENTGEYGLGVIVQIYNSGEVINTVTNLTASHKGAFKFSLCPLETPKQLEEEDCFLPLKLADGSDQYEIGESPAGIFDVQVKLPDGLTCENCVFRWEYITGNTWGDCNGLSEKNDCAPQETFRGCSDIAVL